MPKRQHAVNIKLPTHSPEGEALTGLILRVIRLAGLFSEKGEALAKPAGQTLARWVVLDAAGWGEGLTVADISRRLGYARQSVQRVADLLVEDGLATYEDNPSHLRAKLLRPTSNGKTILDAINGRQRQWSNELGTQVGLAKLKTLSRTLDALLQAMAPERPA